MQSGDNEKSSVQAVDSEMTRSRHGDQDYLLHVPKDNADDDGETKWLMRMARVSRKSWGVLIEKSRSATEDTDRKTDNGWFHGCQKNLDKISERIAEITAFLVIWRSSIKVIDGHFGSAVTSYFNFVKHLFVLNVYITVLIFIFVALPQIMWKDAAVNTWNLLNITTHRINQSEICSNYYQQQLDSLDPDITQIIIDIFQGTGIMENTFLFYGKYGGREGSILSEHGYNIPLAYFLVNVMCLILSLIVIIRKTAKNLRSRLQEVKIKKSRCCNMVFGGWDHTITSTDMAPLKHKSLMLEITVEVVEERDLRRKRERTDCEKCKLYTTRILLNLAVLIILALAGYLVYETTMISAKFAEVSLQNKGHSVDEMSLNDRLLVMLMEYLPSLTITGLYLIVPIIFRVLIQLEDLRPEDNDRLLITRIVLLRLASLVMLFGTIYTQITCDDKDIECDVGQGDCPIFRCWETYVGQQLYKLMVMAILIHIIVILFVELPRRLIVDMFPCKLTKLVGRAPFDIPKSVLEIVYTQILCWMGCFFAPVIPVMCAVQMFIVFYMKKWTTLNNYQTSARPYRASRSHTFFMTILLSGFVLCCAPLGFVFWTIQPSRGCGTFRIYDSMHETLIITINNWPPVLHQVANFFTSTGFLTSLFVFLVILTYYYAAKAKVNKQMYVLAKERFDVERKKH